MAGAGAQHGTRLMPIGTHAVDDVVLGAIEIDQNVASVEASFPGVEEHVVSFAIAQPQKPNQGLRESCTADAPALPERVFGWSRESNESDNNRKAWRPVVRAWLAG